jgi:hypothetical protein
LASGDGHPEDCICGRHNKLEAEINVLETQNIAINSAIDFRLDEIVKAKNGYKATKRFSPRSKSQIQPKKIQKQKLTMYKKNLALEALNNPKKVTLDLRRIMVEAE